MISAAKQKGCSVPAASSHQTVGCGPLSGQQPPFSRWAALKQAPLTLSSSRPVITDLLLHPSADAGWLWKVHKAPSYLPNVKPKASWLFFFFFVSSPGCSLPKGHCSAHLLSSCLRISRELCLGGGVCSVRTAQTSLEDTPKWKACAVPHCIV